MRALAMVALLSLAGCIGVSDVSDDTPRVSVDYAKSTNSQNGVTNTDISATLKAVHGPIEDWSDLSVTGCVAPQQGDIDTPHRFSGCSGRLVIRFAGTGEILYDSGP